MTEAFRDGNASAASARDLDQLLAWLQHFVGRTLRVSEADAADAAQEAVIALLERTLRGDEIRNPAAFLTWLARNRTIDRFRMQARQSEQAVDPEEFTALADDAIARLLDSAASADAVEAALRAAIADGDALVVRVVTAWLDEATLTAAAPTSRAVAARADVSHTSVNQALRRFRAYFPSEGRRTSSDRAM